MSSSYPRPMPSFRVPVAAESRITDDWQTKLFIGASVGEARNLASEWLRDFRDHGPLEIKSIKSEVRGDHSAAIVTHRAMATNGQLPAERQC